MRTTEREDHLAAKAEHEAAQAEWSALYMALQVARGRHDEVRALDLTGQLARANERVTLARQMLGMRAARAKVKEREALEVIKRREVKAYAAMVSAIADQLALLMSIDARLEIPYDSGGLGRMRIPGYASLPIDDTGALVGFTHLAALLPAAAPRVESLLIRELEPEKKEMTDAH